MRDQWYSDKRDLVKWSVLLLLAEKCKADRIIQIACYNTSDYGEIEIAGKQYAMPAEVISHFRNIGKISGLTARPEITVFDAAFKHHDRKSYFEAAKNLMASFNKERCVVFLDPDTGLEPKSGANGKHVRNSELKAIWNALPKGWMLVFYQHQTNRNGQEWIKPKRKQFAKAIGIPVSSVKIASGKKVANDVVFFFSTKTLTLRESDVSKLKSGGTKTTRIGYINRNRQKCTGHRGVAGNGPRQLAYRMMCLDCSHVYGANGADVFQRRCPKSKCQGGRDGILF